MRRDLEEFKAGFDYLKKKIADQRLVEKRVRDTAEALEQAGEELEEELESAREEISMLENGMRRATMDAGELRAHQKDEEIIALKEEIAMLEGGMSRLGTDLSKARMSEGNDQAAPKDNMEMLFRFYDVDGDGTLSLDEFKLACQMALDDEAEITQIFNYIDKDGDGEM